MDVTWLSTKYSLSCSPPPIILPAFLHLARRGSAGKYFGAVGRLPFSEWKRRVLPVFPRKCHNRNTIFRSLRTLPLHKNSFSTLPDSATFNNARQVGVVKSRYILLLGNNLLISGVVMVYEAGLIVMKSL